MSTSLDKAVGIIWRSFLVGAGYALALIIGGMIVGIVGLNLPVVMDAQLSLTWSFVGGIITGLFLGPIAASVPASRKRHFMVWSGAIFFNLVSVAIEGYFFAPELVGDSMTGMFIQLLLASLATGWLVTILFVPQWAATHHSPAHRSFFSWTWRFFLGVLSYVVFYFIFGALNYALVTKPYYETHAGGLAVPSPETVLVAELIRGVLIVLSVLPFLLTVRGSKKRLIFLTGLILFSIGGIVPLTMQTGALPLFLLVASAWEIFAMNFATGWVLARLLGRSE